MKAVLLATLFLAPIALLPAPAHAAISEGACTPYLAFINPNPPHECVSFYYVGINDFCVTAGPVQKCVKFIGPDLA